MAASNESIGLPYSLDHWEELVFRESFIYPLFHPHEAQTIRAFGKMMFYRALEYSGYIDHPGESRVKSDLRGCARDLRLLERSIRCVGESFDTTQVREPDRVLVLMAEDVGPRVGDLAHELESAIGVDVSNG
jgi:hypothetical protein